MKSDRIADLLRPYVELNQNQLSKTSMYIDILLKWNARLNLTAIRDPEGIVLRHFGESYFAAQMLLNGQTKIDVVDVGSGAGFPGVPLAIFSANYQVTLIESSAKKAAFLNEVIGALGLTNTKVFNERADQFAGKGDLVTMRAVERFERSGSVALRLVRERGRAALMIGLAQLSMARTLGGEFNWSEPIAIPGGHSRVILVGIKEVKVG